MSGEAAVEVPFEAHLRLLQSFLAHRRPIVERIEHELNVQRRPEQYLQDRALLARRLEDCFFAPPAAGEAESRLRGRLQAAHWAAGFRPHQVPGLHNDLLDPAEMMMRGFHCWRQTRWPGRNGRLRYAGTLFDLYLLRCLILLSMRALDAGPPAAGARLAQIQTVLDRLWQDPPAGRPRFLRDARWLIPLAQSPTTEDLGAYLEVAQAVAEGLPPADRLEVQRAHLRLVGGHLCSQLRHYGLNEGVEIDDRSVLLRSRTSNALDFALLVQGLVPLLEAYGDALERGDGSLRLAMASAICQGISPDPELFLNRTELLGPYSMIDGVFTGRDREGVVAYTPLGTRHLRLLRSFRELMIRLAGPLLEDCPRFRPMAGSCSPYGVIFGTPSNLIEDMALKSLDPGAETRFGIEDLFIDGDGDAARLAWVNGWRNLPHVPAEVRKLYEYPESFATRIFERIESELRRRIAAGASDDGARTGRLHIEPGALPADAAASTVPDLPARHLRMTDPRAAAALGARAVEPGELLHDRQEGHFLASWQDGGHWVAIDKGLLTEVLGEGQDARIVGLPADVAAVLRLNCPGLVAA